VSSYLSKKVFTIGQELYVECILCIFVVYFFSCELYTAVIVKLFVKYVWNAFNENFRELHMSLQSY